MSLSFSVIRMLPEFSVHLSAEGLQMRLMLAPVSMTQLAAAPSLRLINLPFSVNPVPVLMEVSLLAVCTMLDRPIHHTLVVFLDPFALASTLVVPLLGLHWMTLVSYPSLSFSDPALILVLVMSYLSVLPVNLFAPSSQWACPPAYLNPLAANL
jgi:hypothetical protein